MVSALSLGDRDGLLHALRESSSLAAASGRRLGRLIVILQQAGFAAMEGRFDDLARFVAQIPEAGKNCLSWAPEAHDGYRFVEALESGRVAGMKRDWLPYFTAMIGSASDLEWSEFVAHRTMADHAVVAWIMAFSGERDVAFTELDGLAGFAGPDFPERPQNENWIYAMYLMSDAIERLGAEPHAAVLVPALEPFAKRMACHPSYRLIGGSVASMLGLLSSVLGDFEAGEAYFEAGLAGEEALGARPAILRTQAGLARLLLRRGASGDRDRANKLMDAVVAGCSELGIDPSLRYVTPFESLS